MFDNEALTAALTLLLVAWADGLRIAGSDRVLLARSPVGGWSIRRPFRFGRWVILWQPIGWASVMTSVGQPVGPYQPRIESRIARRAGRVRALLVTTQLVAIVVGAALIAGVPMAAWKQGIIGFAWAMASVLVLSAVQAVLVYAALSRLATPLRERLKNAAACLWPFHAMRGANRILGRLVGEQGIASMRRVSGDALLVETWREPLYDALRERRSSPESDMLIAVLGRERVSDLLRPPPAEITGRRCLRCGASYEAHVAECYDCSVPLEQ